MSRARGLAPAYAIAILMTAGPDDGCPSPRQLADALSAHLPGMVLPLGHATGPDHAAPRRRDRRRRRHARSISPIPRADRCCTAGCRRRARRTRAIVPALAETTALIVERYWHEVGYDVPLERRRRRPGPQRAAASQTGHRRRLRRQVRRRRPNSTASAAAPAVEKRSRHSKPPALEPRAAAEPLPPPRWWLGGSAGSGLLTTRATRDGCGDPRDRGRAARPGDASASVCRRGPRRRVSRTVATGLRLSATDLQRRCPAVPAAHGCLPPDLARCSGSSSPESASTSTSSRSPSRTRRDLRDAARRQPRNRRRPRVGAALPHDFYIRVVVAGRDGGSVPRRNCLQPQDNLALPPVFASTLGLELGVWFP